MNAAILHRQKNIVHLSKALPAIVLALCINHTNSFAQMKVGNNPTTMDASSMLEIEATNQGILLPRISLSNITTWGLAGATPVNGMFVYNSNATTTGGSGIGIYYWANLKWNYVQNGANTAWLLTGNATTTPGTYAAPGTNFIGTTDAIDFAVRTGNTERMRIGSTGQIGINQNFSATNQLSVSTNVATHTAILGQNTTAAGTGGNGIGVYGISAQSTNASYTTNGYGLVALNNNANGTGLYAGGNNVGLNYNFMINGSGAALVGTNVGGFGYSSASSGFGLYGLSSGASGYGVYGVNNNLTAFQYGVFGTYNGSGWGTGVIGVGDNGTIPGSGNTIDVGVFGSANNYGVYGYSTTTGYGVYGQNTSTGTGVRGASVSSGVGVRGINSNTGFGVYGENSGSGIGTFGVSGNTNGTGVAGLGNNLGIYFTFTNGSGGSFTGSSVGVSGFIPTPANGGTSGSSFTTSANAVWGRDLRFTTGANPAVQSIYQFGMYGEKQGWSRNSDAVIAEVRSGGVLGAYYDLRSSSVPAMGALGYVASNSTGYGVYGFGSAYEMGGAGGFSKNTNLPQTGVGIAGIGGLMGGWVNGIIYGFTVKGQRYGMYVDGYSYSNKPSVQLIDNGSSERTVAYNVSSLSADVYAHGKGKMVNGKAQINFDKGFQNIIDANDLAVTVTPIGESNGVHLVSSNASGFSLQENKNADNSFGTSNVEFTWIAVGKRKDVKSSDIANEVLASNFDKNLDGFMSNDFDSTRVGKPMIWTGKELSFTQNTNLNLEGGLKMKSKEIIENSKLEEDSINRKASEMKMKQASPQKNKFLIDKKSQDKNNQSQKDMKKD